MTDIESVLVKCPHCGNTLAATFAGLSLVQHRGRQWSGFVVSIKCELCGQVWKPEQKEDDNVTNYRIAEPEAAQPEQS